MTSVHFSSKTDNWATPQDFFDKLNQEFNFNLDPCATQENAKCKLFYSSEGLEKSWDNFRVFCNPPYGRQIGKWVKKASEAQGGDGSDACSCANRYKVVSRLHLRKGGNKIYQREIEVWRIGKQRTIPFNACNL